MQERAKLLMLVDMNERKKTHLLDEGKKRIEAAGTRRKL